MRKIFAFALIAIFLIAAAVFVSAEDAVSTTSETTSAFSSSGTSGSFSSSNPQTFAPGLSGSFSGGNYQGYYGGSSVDINAVCRDRKDFVVQIAPGGCTPAVVRSDLLEEQDVLVYCKLQAVMVNPTIAAEKMSNVILTSQGQTPSGLAGIAYYPPRSALSQQRDSNGFLAFNNIGYAVLIIKRQYNESSMPEFVTGNMTARIQYDVPVGFGTGVNEMRIPVLTNEEWHQRYKEFSFLNGRAFLRVESVSSDKAQIGIYMDVDRRISSFTINTKKISSPLYLDGNLCNSGFTATLSDLALPEPTARIEIDNDNFDVIKGAEFAEDYNCRVLDVQAFGAGTGSARIDCNGKTLALELRRRNVFLSVDGGEQKEYSIGDVVKEEYYFGYAGKLFDKTTDFVLLVQPVNPKSFKDIEKEVNNLGEEISFTPKTEDVAKKIEEQNKKEDKKFKIIMIRGGEIEDTTKVTFSGFSSIENEVITNEFSGVFGKAKEGYGDVEENYGSLDYPAVENGKYGKISVEKLLRLAQGTNQFKIMYEYITKYSDKYKGEIDFSEFEKLNDFDLSSAIGSFEIDGYSHTVRLVSVKAPLFEDKGVEVNVNGNLKRITEGDYLDYSDSENIQLESFDDNSIKVSANCATDTAGKTEKASEEIPVGTQKAICNKNIYVKKINLKRVAVVKVDSVTKDVSSVVNVSYAIGIEKRLIQLNPEKSLERIKRLNESIAKWQNISESLGTVVKTMKAACFATSAVMQVKALAEGMNGGAIARQQIMKGQGGWNELCNQALANSGNPGDLVEKYGMTSGKYNDLEDCYRKNADAIDADVKFYRDIVSQHDKDIKAREEAGNAVTKSGIFGGESVDTEKAIGIHLGAVQKYSLVSELIDANDKDKKLTAQDANNILQGLDPGSVGVSDLQRTELLLRVYQSKDTNVRIKAMAESELYGELSWLREEQANNPTSVASEMANAAGWGDGVGLGVSLPKDLNALGQQIPGEVYNGYTALATKGQITQGTPVHAVLYRDGSEIKKYFVTLQPIDDSDIYTPVGVFETDGSLVSDQIKTKVLAEHSQFTKVDANSYNNKYTNPEVRYHETEPYKGLAALVPIDTNKGWYAATKPIISSFGNVEAFQESGRVSSFWLCNVGTNGREEFDAGFGDDICQQFNAFTGQKIGTFYGLSEQETNSWVGKAIKVLEEASSKYKAGISEISIGGNKYKVGNPAASIPGTTCAEFMSPKDCQIMFNVCDPVICPASRCNLGGKYHVSDVVQSGIVGSIFLCLPNAKEGIIVPVCLTGIKAGIDSFTSILEASRDCLQENINTGRYVGICDEVTAIYKCEFFWRQFSPLINTIIPKLLEKVTGQGARGGGEYLSVASAWENMQKSIDYFKNYYAINAMNAFRVRSTQEVGTSVCKSFVSIAYPNKFKALIEPDSPPQFAAWFDEIPQTTATVPAQSHYKVYYHIFSGADQGTQYSVYLKDSTGISYFESSGSYVVDTGYVPAGGYVDQAKDFIAPSGFKQLCVRVNTQEECGFKQVSTSFALNYLRDKYIEQQAGNTKITSEKTCISGTASAYGLLNPNLQSGVEEAAMPELYNRGITRVCATNNPGEPTSPERWQDVGYCDSTKIRCWIDRESISDAITDGNYGALDKTIASLNEAADEAAKVDGGKVKPLLSSDSERTAFYTFNEIADDIMLEAVSSEDYKNLINELNTEATRLENTYQLTDVQKARIEFTKAWAYDGYSRALFDAWLVEKHEDDETKTTIEETTSEERDGQGTASATGTTAVSGTNIEIPNILIPLFKEASKKTGVPPELLAAISHQECGDGKESKGTHLWYDAKNNLDDVRGWISEDIDPPSGRVCNWNNGYNVFGPMQFRIGKNYLKKNYPNLEIIETTPTGKANPDVGTWEEVIEETGGIMGKTLLSPLKIKDSFYAAGVYLKKGAGTIDSNGWTDEKIKAAAKKYFGRCEDDQTINGETTHVYYCNNIVEKYNAIKNAGVFSDTSTTPTTPISTTGVRTCPENGDINADGILTMADAQALQDSINNDKKNFIESFVDYIDVFGLFPPQEQKSCDITGDGTSDKEDVEQVVIIVRSAEGSSSSTTPVPAQTTSTEIPTEAELVPMIAKMIMTVPSAGATTTCDEDIVKYKGSYIGGVIIMGYNVNSENQVKTLIADCKKKGIKLISADVEGKGVNRLEKLGVNLGYPRTLCSEALAGDDFLAFNNAFSNAAQKMYNMGINIDFAPVLDIAEDTDFMGNNKRSFSNSVEGIKLCATQFISDMTGKVLVTGKHFPGYISHESDKDGNSDENIVTADESFTSIKTTNMKPFIDLRDNLDAIMMSNIIYNGKDVPWDKKTPAVFVPGLNPHNMPEFGGWDGLVITDALNANSLSKYSCEDRAVLAVKAGNDILLNLNSREVGCMIDGVVTAVKTEKSGELLKKIKAANTRIDTAVAKVSA